MFSNFSQIDSAITAFLARSGIPLLRIALGIIFFWFGVLKFFPGESSAEELAAQTITRLSSSMVSERAAVFLLAVLETAVGLGLIFGIWLRGVLALLVFQMIGTFTPLVLFPEITWRKIPFVPTLEGQYIIKNIVLLSAALVLGATVRGGRLVADPDKTKED